MSAKVLMEMEKLKDPFCGLGQYCMHLGRELNHLRDGQFSPYYYVPEKYSLNIKGPRIGMTKLHRKLNFLRPDCDLFWATHQDSPYLPRKQSTPFIMTVHDLNFLYEEKTKAAMRLRLNELQRKLDRANYVITVSEFTKYEIIKNCDYDARKITPIHNGVKLIRLEEDFVPMQQPNGSFLFTLGAVIPKKNFHVLIPMLSQIPDLQLYIAGSTYHEYTKKLLSLARKHHVQNRIHLLGNIDEKNKTWYLVNCEAFVFPSLVEGFGIPVAEALSVGTKVICSNKTSLPEIGGNEAVYWENFEPDHMAEVLMNTLIEDHSSRESRMEWGARYHWKTAAHLYKDIFIHALNKAQS